MAQAKLLSLIILAVMVVVSVPLTSFALIDVWIDSGHGGVDPGTLGFNGSAYPDEKDINLLVSQSIQNSLLRFGYISYLSRGSDVYLSHKQRVRIANGEKSNYQDIQASCQLFISIHMNGSNNSEVFGTETYYSKNKTYAKRKGDFVADKNAAEDIHPALMSYAAIVFLFPCCNDDRGVKCKNFYVLKNSKSPSYSSKYAS